jgi:excisionase family DNA binding protein
MERQSTGHRRFLYVKEAAALMRVSDVTLYREIAAGRFPAVKIGTRYSIPVRAIDALERAALTAPGALFEEMAAAWAEAAQELAS